MIPATSEDRAAPEGRSRDQSPWAVFLIFLRLGLTSFGGPVAHLGYFHQEFVARRKWLSEGAYADLVALCQFLPGPASSQVGMGLGLMRAGYAGALAAWAGFTLPSALLLILFALGLSSFGEAPPDGLLQGLKAVAAAVVAQAVWSMARGLCPDRTRQSFMVAAACGALFLPSVWGQVGVILAGALAGLLLCKPNPSAAPEPLAVPIGRRAGLVWLGIFALLLIALPVLARLTESHALALIDAFYRVGALVFGGGHVVLPLLQAETVTSGWVAPEAFLAGYGVVQAAPGPLFSFAAFLGASMSAPPSGWLGGMLCLLAIFAPAFLLTIGALPFWESLRRIPEAQAALMGINAAVVGLLLAALYDPVWVSAVKSSGDFALALTAFAALVFWKAPPWLVVLAGGAAGWGLSLV